MVLRKTIILVTLLSFLFQTILGNKIEEYREAAINCNKANPPSAAVRNKKTKEYDCEPFLSQGSCDLGKWRVMNNRTIVMNNRRFDIPIPICIERPCAAAINRIPLGSRNSNQCATIGDPTHCENGEVVRANAFGFGRSNVLFTILGH